MMHHFFTRFATQVTATPKSSKSDHLLAAHSFTHSFSR